MLERPDVTPRLVRLGGDLVANRREPSGRDPDPEPAVSKPRCASDRCIRPPADDQGNARVRRRRDERVPEREELPVEGDGRAVGQVAQNPQGFWCRRSADLARASGRPDLEAHALIYLGVARNGLGDPAGLAHLTHALHLAERGGHHEYLGRAASTLATVLIWHGRHVEAVPYLDVAERTARERGHDYHLFHTLVQRCHVDLVTGRWEAADRRLRALLAADQDPGAVLTMPLALLARLQARRGGDVEGDTGLAARSWTIATQSRQTHRMAIAGGALIEDAWLRGDVRTVVTVAGELLPVAERAHLPFLGGEVVRYLRRVGVRADPFPGCPSGYAHGVAGEWRAAAAAWAEAGNPYEEALELCEAPYAEEACTGIRRLDELGAIRAATVMRHHLRRRGFRGIPRGPQPATRQNVAGLTSRQFTVLTLLAERLTSAEIAERLYLSRRTVDNHVNAILTKLAVPSRRRVVALATERGWLPGAAPSHPGGSPMDVR